MIRSDLESSMLYQINNARFKDHPYPHLVIRNFFPCEFFQEIEHHLPDSNAYLPLEDHVQTVKKGAYPERFIFPLESSKLKDLPMEQALFWTDLCVSFYGDLLQKALLKKFEFLINNLLHEKIESDELQLRRDIALVKDFTGYQIPPHPDTNSKVLTMLIYLPSVNVQNHMGTSIYIPRDVLFKSYNSSHRYPEGTFHRAYTVPFEANTAFIFCRTDNSFHGVEKIKELGVQRNTLSYVLGTEVKG